MKIRIIYANAGQGHKQIGKVVYDEFVRQGLDHHEVSFEDILDSTNPIFRKAYPAIYYCMVKYFPRLWGWFYMTLDRPEVDFWMGPLNSLFNRLNGQKILKQVMDEQTDVIISTHFFPSELFARAKSEGRIRTKIITVVTDYYPHVYWIRNGTDIYWVMSEECRDVLMKRGVPEKNIIVGGIPIAPIFKATGEKAKILQKWQFDPNRFTLLLTSGSFGFGPHQEILESLRRFKDEIQCFVVCGNNQDLKSSLDKVKFDFPVKVFGFIDFMADLMEAADLMIAKPGGSTATESLAKGIPMVVIDPIPGQESWNASVLKERNAAFFMKDPKDVQVIMKYILEEPHIMDSKRKEIARLARPDAAANVVKEALK